jgi:hypothetical protein
MNKPTALRLATLEARGELDAIAEQLVAGLDPTPIIVAIFKRHGINPDTLQPADWSTK